jgi:hypothetical protein
MKKTIIILCLMFGFLSCNVNVQKKESSLFDTNEQGLFGRPKLVEQRCYSIKDSLGNLIKEKINFIETFDLLFDSLGNLIERKHYGIDNLFWYKIKMYYDKNANLIKTEQYDKDGQLNEIERYYYNAENLLIKKESPYIGNNKWLQIEKYIYSSNKIEKSKETYITNFKDTVLYNEIIKYQLDSVGNIISEKSYDDSLISENYYKYNTMGLKIEEKCRNAYRSKIFNYFERHKEYDKYGNIIKEKGFYDIPDKKVDEIIVYCYKFDKKNNWISKLKYLNEIPVLSFERNIEYY